MHRMKTEQNMNNVRTSAVSNEPAFGRRPELAVLVATWVVAILHVVPSVALFPVLPQGVPTILPQLLYNHSRQQGSVSLDQTHSDG